MSPKRTKRVPRHVANDLLYQADQTCCICRLGKYDVQIHHIDPGKDNRPDNLIPVCPNCHSEIERKGGLGRRYSPGVLKKLRDEWFSAVRRRRQQREATKDNTDLIAMAAFEVRRISYEIELQERWHPDWSKIDECLITLIPWARDFGYEVKSEATYVASITADRTRDGMPPGVARTLSHLLAEILPIAWGGLRSRSRRKVKEQDKNLVRRVAQVGFTMCYDAVRHLRNPKIAEEGAQVLYMALRFAYLNELHDIKKEILDHFQSCQVSCGESVNGQTFPKGKEILDHFRAHALRED